MTWFGRLWRAVETLPGPLWLVGAYGCLRLFQWLDVLLLQGLTYAGRAGISGMVVWPQVAICLGSLLGVALPLWLFGWMAMRCADALPLIK